MPTTPSAHSHAGFRRILTQFLALVLPCAMAAAAGVPQSQPAGGQPQTAPLVKEHPNWPPPDSDLLPYPEGFDVLASSPQAIALVISAQDDMGSLAEWNKLPALRYTFVVEKDGKEVGARLHYWDRVKNRHRLEMVDEDGRAVAVTQDLASQSGSVAIDGKTVTGAQSTKLLETGYAAWVNDTYWLIMPLKTLDAGVRLSYEGARSRGGKRYLLVKVQFDAVGLTPGDTYWAWIHETTRRMSYWSYRLQNTPAQQPESTFAWEEWQSLGPLTLSTVKRQVDVPTGTAALTIRFRDLALPGPLPDALFEAASTAPEGLAP